MADQLVSGDPNWTGAPATGPHMGPAHADSALPMDESVTLGDLKSDPVGSMQKIGTLLKKDVSDPRLWIGLAASYFAPKMLDVALPLVARAAMKTRAAAGELATPAMAKDLGVTVLGDARINAGLRIAGRLRSAASAGDAVSAAAAPVAAPVVAAEAPSAAPAVTAAPLAPPTPAAAVAAVKDVFKTLKIDPGPADLTNAASMMKFGKTAEQAVARVLQLRLGASGDVAAKLAETLGTPSDATVGARVAARNATGRWQP